MDACSSGRLDLRRSRGCRANTHGRRPPALETPGSAVARALLRRRAVEGCSTVDDAAVAATPRGVRVDERVGHRGLRRSASLRSAIGWKGYFVARAGV